MKKKKHPHQKKRQKQPGKTTANATVKRRKQKTASEHTGYSSKKTVKQTHDGFFAWQHNNKLRFGIYAIFIALCFALYSNTIPFGYTFDDKLSITKNQFTQKGLDGIGDILTHDFFTSYFGKKQNLVPGGRYRPFTLITFAIEWEFFADKENEKGNPHVSHFINILLYAATAILLFQFITYIFSSRATFDNRFASKLRKPWYLSIPFLTVILFIAHPLHTEVVANIKSRDEIMVLLGSVLTMFWVMKALKNKKTIAFLLYMFGATIVFFLALMSKENAITFLAVLPLTLYYFTKPKTRQYVTSFVPLLIASVVFLIIRYNILGTFTTEIPPELMNNPFLYASTSQKYATIFLTFGTYLKLLFFPHPLTYDYYPYHIPLISWSDWRAIVPLLLYIIIGIYAIYGLRRKDIYSYGIWFYFFTFSIVSNILIPIGAFMNERFIFVSSFGFSLIVAGLLSNKIPSAIKNPKIRYYPTIAVLCIVLGLYSFKTVVRNQVWKDDYTLFTTDVQTSKESAFSNLTAGKQFYFKAKDLKDEQEKAKYFKLAIKHLTKAVTIHKQYVNGLFFLSEAHYQYNENWKKSIEYLERLFPLTPDKASVPYRLGALYGKHTDNKDKAIYYLQKTLEVDPKYHDALKNLGVLYFQKKQYEKALEYLLKYKELEPDDIKVYKYLGAVYQTLGDKQKAAEFFTKAKALEKKK